MQDRTASGPRRGPRPGQYLHHPRYNRHLRPTLWA